jgi:hypothetical protein
MPIGDRIRKHGKRRKIRMGESYTADEEVDLEGVEPDAALVPESEQHGDLEHEGGPEDDGN